MAVSVITDSAASLPPELAERAGVTVVPMWVTIGTRTYRDNEVSLEEVLARADEGLSTSGPSSGDVLEAIEHHGSDDGTLILTVAGTMSSTYQAARSAAARLSDSVRVLDTATAAGAQGLVVLAAAERARAGAGLDEVEGAARRAAKGVRLVASLPSLEWLARGGHVPGVAAWAGRSLGLRPLIEFRGGKIRPLRPVRGDRAAFDAILDPWRRSRTAGRLHVAALHALAAERAEQLLGAVREEVEPATAFVGPFSSVMVAHTGPGLLGLAWWWETD